MSKFLKKYISISCIVTLVFVSSISTAFASNSSKISPFEATSSATITSKGKVSNLKDILKSTLSNDVEALSMSMVSTLSLTDPYETNDDISTAAAMPSDTIYANIGYADDVDFYTKSFSQGQSIAVSLKNIPSGCDYDLYLADINGNVLASSENGGNSNELILGTINTTATYIVGIIPYSGYNDSQNYTLYAGDAVKTGTGSNWYNLAKLQLNYANTLSSVDTLDLTNDSSIPTGATVTSMYLYGSYTGNFGNKTMQCYISQATQWYDANLSDMISQSVGKNVKQVWKYRWQVQTIIQPVVSWTPDILINYTYQYTPY